MKPGAGREGKGDFSIRFAEVIDDHEPMFRTEVNAGCGDETE